MNKKIIIAVVVVVLVIGGGFYMFANPSQAPVKDTSTTTPVVPEVASFTMADVATHNTSASCYSVVRGKVYDLSRWIEKHPGGSEAILWMCGKDATEAFVGQHGGQRKPEEELKGFDIGILK